MQSDQFWCYGALGFLGLWYSVAPRFVVNFLAAVIFQEPLLFPILFLISMSELSNTHDTNQAIYADETGMFLSFRVANATLSGGDSRMSLKMGPENIFCT